MPLDIDSPPRGVKRQPSRPADVDSLSAARQPHDEIQELASRAYCGKDQQQARAASASATEADRWQRTDFEVPVWPTPLAVPWQRGKLIPPKAYSRVSGEGPATTRGVADGCGASPLDRSRGIMAHRGWRGVERRMSALSLHGVWSFEVSTCPFALIPILSHRGGQPLCDKIK